MKTRLTVIVAVIALLVLAAGAAPKQDARAAVDAAGKTFSAAVAAGDTAKIAEDAQAFPPNSTRADGRAAIQKMWADFLATGVKKIDLKTLEVEQSGDYAYEVGTYSISGEADKHLDHGKYVVVWKRVGGQWKLFRDIWNSDMAAGPQ
jgi:ketosteroid isomerase-like protein